MKQAIVSKVLDGNLLFMLCSAIIPSIKFPCALFLTLLYKQNCPVLDLLHPKSPTQQANPLFPATSTLQPSFPHKCHFYNLNPCCNYDDHMTSQKDSCYIIIVVESSIINSRPKDQMRNASTVVSQDNSNVLLKKLLELKKTVSSSTSTSIDNISDSLSSKGERNLLEELPTDTELDNSDVSGSKMEIIRSQIVGLRTVNKSPFGYSLETLYADHTATNRAYSSIEELIASAKYLSANPHTEFSHFGKYSTAMMEYSQQSILSSFEAKPEEFVALPTGSGSTGAIEKTLRILKSLNNQERTTIFLTPYEHHSNILPWIELYENIKVLPSTETGDLIYEEIEKALMEDESEMLIVSISAASNVTSKLTNLARMNQIIKNVRLRKRVVFCIDCAAFCSHKQFSFNKYTETDFVFLSPHKNLGGSETCGVLIGRKNIIELSKPTFPGGGTVKFVKGYKKEDIMYEDNIFSRQISGTPSFLGFYRAALSFELLKKEITYSFIAENEKDNLTRFISKIDAINHRFKSEKKDVFIVMYGERDFQSRGNIVTFNILKNGELLSHNLVSLILSDLFGIQIRSGCFCAGPFGIKLLNLSEETIQQLESQVSIGILKNKPGYCRLDMAFHFLPFEVDYIARALEMICEYGNQLSLFYTLCNDGEIRRLPLLKEEAPIFSLAHFTEKRENPQSSPLLNLPREENLRCQLQRAEGLLKNPIQFLKTLRK